MIPMTVAENGEILNMTAIVRIVEKEDKSLDVTTVDGTTKNYTDKAANIIRGQGMINVEMYQNYLKSLTGNIITGANGKPKIF